MKILFILDLYKPHIWWVEILFENIISRLDKEWHKVVVLTSKYEKDIKEYERMWNNIEVYRVWTNKYNFMFFCLSKGFFLAKWVDLIHTTTYSSAIPAKIIWRLSKKKVVITVHEIFWHLWYTFLWWKGFFFKVFESLIFKFTFEKYICVSNYTRNSLRIYSWIDDIRLVTIYNWIDYKTRNKERFNISDIKKTRKENNLEEYFSWLFFGRPWISKWLEYYIRSIPLILRKIPNFKAVLIISKQDHKRFTYILKLIEKMDISSNVILIDSVKYQSLWNYILATDFVVVPSLAEWFGFCAAEVSSLDQKLLVSNAGSLPEVVSGKVNFVNPQSMDDIVDGVWSFYNDEYASIHKKYFYRDENIQKTLAVYKELLWK